MRINTKKLYILPLLAVAVMATSFVSALSIPADSAYALTAKQCRDKYNSKKITQALENKFEKDKCSLLVGGVCGGTLSAGEGYYACPDTSKANAFCKKKYPSDAAKRNACRSGYFSNISGCASFAGNQKKACEVGEKEFNKQKDAATPPEEKTDGGLSGVGAGDDCGGVDTAIIKCSQDNSGDLEDNGIWGLLMIVLNILTAGIGIVAVGGIVYGSVLYTTAEDKADQVKQATDIITNVVIGLVAFAFMWALLNFIVPGGVFN